MKRITDYLSYLPASEEPLSADVFFITGQKKTYIFDVGASSEALEEIRRLTDFVVILSHFHEDHTANLRFLPQGRLYAGRETIRHTGYGQEISQHTFLNDGIALELIPFPSSHAKGCIAVNIEREYALLGDGIYAKSIGGKPAYTVSLLYETIRVLKAMDTKYCLLSHDKKLIYTKEEVLAELEAWYRKREKNNPYIYLN